MSCKCVLLVDDDDRLQKMLTCNFVQSGFDVVSAKDGLSAIETLETLRPAIILLDLAMPGMDGFKFCRRIKEDLKWREIPVIVISALSAAGNRERVQSIGVSDYFEKPFIISELMDRVFSLLGNKGDIVSSNPVKLNFKGGRL